MKTTLLAAIVLLLTACVNPMATARHRVLVVDAESGIPQPGVEFEVLALKRPYWVVGHLHLVGSAISDSQGFISIPEHALVLPSEHAGWIEDLTASAPSPDSRIRIKKKTGPNKAVEPTPAAVTVPACAGTAPSTSAAHLNR
jgi:hypothetical protein